MAKIYRFEVATINDFTGQEQVSGLHYQTNIAGGGSETSPSTILDKIMSHFSSSGHNLSKWTDAAYSPCSFTGCAVREEVEWWNHEIGDTANEPLALSGGLGSTGSSATPDGLAPWIKLTSDAASRSGRGGVHLPGPFAAVTLDSDGQWGTGFSLWTKIVALGDAIVDAIEDYDLAGSDLLPVIYSVTRRRRHDTPFTFQITHAVPSVEPRWLRRRMRAG